MRTKIIIAVALLAAFLGGALAVGFTRQGPSRTLASQEGASNLSTAPIDLSRGVLVNCNDGSVAIARLTPDGQIQIDCANAGFTGTNYAVTPSFVSTQPGAVPVYERRTTPAVERVVERRVVQRQTVSVRRHRSWQKEVAIVAGSAGGGAAIGAVAGGKKGAAIGAVAGGVAGLVYDLATRNK